MQRPRPSKLDVAWPGSPRPAFVHLITLPAVDLGRPPSPTVILRPSARLVVANRPASTATLLGLISGITVPHTSRLASACSLGAVR